MVMYRRTYLQTPVYQFVGSEHDWRRLIIGNAHNFKTIYLLDCEANRRMYPPEIKVINSELTIKRVNFVELNNAAIFIGRFQRSEWMSMNWTGANCFVIRTDLKNLLKIIEDNLLERSSKKNSRYLKKYK